MSVLASGKEAKGLISLFPSFRDWLRLSVFIESIYKVNFALYEVAQMSYSRSDQLLQSFFLIMQENLL